VFGQLAADRSQQAPQESANSLPPGAWRGEARGDEATLASNTTIG